MNAIKPIIGFLLSIGVMSLWIFQVYNNSKTNEVILDQRINKIDSRINELKTDISFLTIKEINN